MQPDWQSPDPTRNVTLYAIAPEAGSTVYQLAWPVSSGSRALIPAKRGSLATTRATASSGEVTGASPSDDPPGAVGGAALNSGELLGLVAGEFVDAPLVHPATAAAISAARTTKRDTDLGIISAGTMMPYPRFLPDLHLSIPSMPFVVACEGRVRRL
jgi:hypothetical protein